MDLNKSLDFEAKRNELKLKQMDVIHSKIAELRKLKDSVNTSFENMAIDRHINKLLAQSESLIASEDKWMLWLSVDDLLNYLPE